MARAALRRGLGSGRATVESVADREQALAGGNSLGGAVRVGETVRKPWTAATPAVIEFMAAVRTGGVDVPEVLGRDEQGRQVQEFVSGRLAMDLGSLSVAQLARVAGIVRAIHDVSEGFVPVAAPRWQPAIRSPGHELICHGDLAPWNLIVGERWVFIDWDGAGPSTRLWDLAYSAQAFTLNDPDAAPVQAAGKLAAFIDAYGAGEQLREELPAVLVQRVAAMYELLRSSNAAGIEPWSTLYVTGHGAHWQAVLQYVKDHQRLWARALTADRSP